MERYDEAIEWLDKAIEKEPENTKYLDLKGKCLLELEEYEEAEKYLSESVDVLKELEVARYLADALSELGKAQMNLEKYEDAKGKMEESIKLYDSLDLLERKSSVEADLEKLTKHLK